jgi:hypothetical protein
MIRKETLKEIDIILRPLVYTFPKIKRIKSFTTLEAMKNLEELCLQNKENIHLIVMS